MVIRKIACMSLFGILALWLGSANAVVIPIQAGTPTAALHGASLVSTPGTVAIGEVASHVSGGGQTGIGTCYPSGSACDPGGAPVSTAAAASGVDHYWVQGGTIAFGFSSPTSTVVAAAGIDHGPVPFESLEFILWGSSDGSSLNEEGAILSVYDLGIDGSDGPDLGGAGGPGFSAGDSDDYSSVWTFANSWSFFVVTPGDHIAGADSPGEYEIDGLAKLASVPEPSALALLGLGLLGVALGRRRG